MGSHRKNSLTLHPCWFLLSSLLILAPVLPALSLDTLLCYFCPLHQKDQACPQTTSQCLPGQRCSGSRGHRGVVHVLSAQGCVDVDLCGSQEVVAHRGVRFNVTHTCCCKDKCNDAPKSDSSLKKLLGITPKREDIEDSCANYTSSATKS